MTMCAGSCRNVERVVPSFAIRFLLSCPMIWLLLAMPLFAANIGDISIFTDTTGGENVSGTFTHTFGNGAIRNDAGLTLGGGSDTITFGASDAGHWLVLYNSIFERAGGSNRSSVQSSLNLNGTDLALGWSHAYMRRSDGNDEFISNGFGLIHVADTDVLRLNSYRGPATNTDAGNLTNVIRADGPAGDPLAANTGLQLLKLDDSWQYLELTRSLANQAGTTTGGVANVDQVTSRFCRDHQSHRLVGAEHRRRGRRHLGQYRRQSRRGFFTHCRQFGDHRQRHGYVRPRPLGLFHPRHHRRPDGRQRRRDFAEPERQRHDRIADHAAW